ncbi:MAG: hypothetical protein NTX65_05000 [Ignavibacteriales bacterium]|nr:hypothetical protein [Ignavibacteriales bacterium]
MASKESIPFAHWSHLTEGLQESAQKFYASVEESVKKRQIPDIKLSRIDYKEGGLFSAKREYLRVKWKSYIFDICAAPFGTGFFMSWWLGQIPSPIMALVYMIPFIGPLMVRSFKPETYYQLDTTQMFQESIHLAVLEVLDQTTQASGLRLLTESERKPIMQDLLKKS